MENLISADNINYYIEQCHKSNDPHRKAAGILLKHLCQTFDMDIYREIAETYINGEYSFFQQSGHDYKFLNLPYWLHDKTVLYMNSEILGDTSLNILDIGSGPGHFLLVARLMGHRVHGLDIPHALYDDLFSFFRLPKTHHAIEALKPLPQFNEKFDLITAHYANFNSNSFVGDESMRSQIAWGEAEWLYFLTDLKENILNTNGIIEFKLNPLEHAKTGLRDSDGSLLTFFETRGARIKNAEHRIVRIDNMKEFNLEI